MPPWESLKGFKQQQHKHRQQPQCKEHPNNNPTCTAPFVGAAAS
jgi:hypothetical protein